MSFPGVSDSDIFRIIYWAISKCSYPETILVEDLVQEAWSAALEAGNSYDPSRGTKPTSWLTTCIICHLKNYIAVEVKQSGKFKQLPENRELEDHRKKKPQEYMFLSVLKKVVSPLAFCLLVIRIRTYPLRVKREDIVRTLRITPGEVDLVSAELKWGIKTVKQYLEN